MGEPMKEGKVVKTKKFITFGIVYVQYSILTIYDNKSQFICIPMKGKTRNEIECGLEVFD